MRPLIAILAGASATLAFSPYQYWLFAILSPALLLILLHKQPANKAFFIGYCWGIGQFSTGVSWVYVSIDNFGGMPKVASLFLMALLIGYLAIYPALFSWCLNRLFINHRLQNNGNLFTKNKLLCNRRRFFFVVPALWLLFDWARGWIMTGFPWLWLGYSQIDTPLANFAPLGGVELLTLLVILSASALTFAILYKRPFALLLPICLFATGYSLQNVEWVTLNPAKSTKIALIQGNIDQSLKWKPEQRWPTIMKYVELSQQYWDADIIIWPEAAIPAFELELPSFLTQIDQLARTNDSSIITGILNQTQVNQYYNSILTLGKTPADEYQYQPLMRYNKYHLLPFGEFVPFEEWLRPLAPFFNLPMSSFSRGDYVQPNIVANGRHLTPALCYEIIFNEQVRANTTDETDFILTLSNDAWFGRSIGPLQHMEIARMRALELGKPLIRSTNNGVTAVTDHKGNIIKQIPQFETAVLTTELYSTIGRTPYQKWGSYPLYVWVLFSLLLGLNFRNGNRSRLD